MPYPVTQGGPGERLPVAVGTGVWALLFLIGLTLRPELESTGRGWWIWTALAGVLLGFVGYAYLMIRRPKIQPGDPAHSTDAADPADAVVRRRSTGDVDDVARQNGDSTGLPRLRRGGAGRTNRTEDGETAHL